MKFNKSLKGVMTYLTGFAVFYILVGLYAPHYKIEKHGLGYATLGEYQQSCLPGLSASQKFFGMANTVVFDVITFGFYMESLALTEKMKIK